MLTAECHVVLMVVCSERGRALGVDEVPLDEGELSNLMSRVDRLLPSFLLHPSSFIIHHSPITTFHHLPPLSNQQ
jgi:hypothetical protein